MSDTMVQEEAMNMSYEQAVQILIPMRIMMCDQNGCPISDAVFALDKAIEALSADRPQGKWVPFEYGDERWHKCTVCGVADRYIEYVERPNGTTGKLVAIRNYCPNCGARMKGADHE